MKQLVVSVLITSAVWLATTAGAGEANKVSAWEPGRHYLVLIPKVQTFRQQADKIEVVEVFSYTCGVCFAFEPYVEKWKGTQRDDIDFVRMPVVWRGADRAYARLFYTLQALGKESLHAQVFALTSRNHNALYDVDEGRTLELQLKFAEGHGIGREAFLAAYNSKPVLRNVDRASMLAHSYLVDRTPTLVVNGKYTSNIARTGWDMERPESEIKFGPILELVDELAGRERESARPEHKQKVAGR